MQAAVIDPWVGMFRRKPEKEGGPSHSESREAILLLPSHNLAIRGRGGGRHGVGTYNGGHKEGGDRDSKRSSSIELGFRIELTHSAAEGKKR